MNELTHKVFLSYFLRGVPERHKKKFEWATASFDPVRSGGLDSHDMFEVMEMLENGLGIKIDLGDTAGVVTLGNFRAMVNRLIREKSEREASQMQ